MKLRSKFNVTLTLAALVALGVASIVSYKILEQQTHEQVMEQASFLMDSASTVRHYTVKEIRPVIQDLQFQVKTLSGLIAEEALPPDSGQDYTSTDGDDPAAVEEASGPAKNLTSLEFHPQTVPAYAANQYISALREKYPDYNYKEATLNPTNQMNRAQGWEVDVVEFFRNSPGQTELIGQRETPMGTSLPQSPNSGDICRLSGLSWQG